MLLGRAPLPSRDDPMSISPWLTIPYYLTGLLMVGFPVAIVGGLLTLAWLKTMRRISRLLTMVLLLSFAGVWAASISFLRWDPLDVVNWYMD